MFKKSIIAISLLLSTQVMAKEVIIGAVLPMSGSLAAFGQIAYEGIKVASKIQPTLSNGDTVKVVLLDNKGEKVETQNGLNKLIENSKAITIIGPLTSSNAVQAIQTADQKKIPMVTPTASLDTLLDRSRFASRVMFKDAFQGTAVAKYALAKGIDSAVVIADQAQVYSVGLAKAFEEAYGKDGGKVLKRFNITSGDKDFRAILSQVKDLNPKAIFMPIYHPEAALIARQAREIGVESAFMGGDGLANQVYIDLGGNATEGTVYTGSFDADHPQTKTGENFADFYAKENNGSRAIADFTALAADAYFIVVDAMNRCISNLTPTCINTKIHETTNFQGVSGIITIDKKGNATRSVTIKKVVDGAPKYEYTVNP